MNNSRRKEIGQAIKRLEDIVGILENILADEEEAFENMPESLQSSDNGMTSEEAQEKLSDAIADLEIAIESLGEI